MRFGLIHRIMTDALAALGLLSLVTSGELDPAVSGAIVIGLVAAIAIPERWQDRTPLRQFSVAAPILLLVTQAVRLFLGAEVLQLAVEFCRCAPDRPPRDQARRRPRSASHRPGAAPPHRGYGAGNRSGLRSVFLRLPGGRTGGAGAQPPAPRGGGQLSPGGARPHRPARGRAAHPPQPARHRSAVLDFDVPAVTAHLHLHHHGVPALSASGLVAAAVQPSAAGTHGGLLGQGRPRGCGQAPKRSHHRHAGRVSESDGPAPAAARAVPARHWLRPVRRSQLVAQQHPPPARNQAGR